MTATGRPRSAPPAPAAGPEERVPVMLLGGAALLLAASLVYPSGAFPWHGLMTGGATVLLAAIALLFAWTKARTEGTGFPGGLVALLAVAGAWGLYWTFNNGPGTTEAAWLGRAFGYSVCTSAFVTGLTAAWTWRLPRPHASTALSLFLLGLVALLALFGLYQVHGPEGFPRTFRTLEQALLRGATEEGGVMQEGLLHAVREGRASSTLGAPNIFASFLVFAAPIAAVLPLAAGGGRVARRVALGMPLLLILAAVLASGSRGGLLALLFGLALAAALPLLRRARGRTAAWVLVSSVGVFALAALVAIIAVWRVDAGESRWLGASGMTQRGYYWQTALAIWTEEPLLGQGSGAFEMRYPQYRIPGSNETRHAHSWLMEFLAEGGLVGTALFLMLAGGALLYAVMGLARNRHGPDPGAWYLRAALMAGVLALLAHGLVEYTLAFREALHALALGLGVLAGSGLREHPAPLKGQVPGTAAGLMLLLLPATGGFSVYTWELPARRAELLRMELEDALARRAPAQEVRAIAEDLAAANPRDPANWEWAAHVARETGTGEAMAYYEEALRLNPFSARLRERVAFHHAGLGNLEEAIAWQLAAVELHPLSATRHLNLARLYMQAGDRPAAIEAFGRTDGLLLPSLTERAFREEVRRELGLPVPLSEVPEGALLRAR